VKYLARAFAPQVLIGLVGGLVLTLLFLWLAVAGSAVPPAPHNVPVAAVDPDQRSPGWPAGCSAAAST
jgi:hypothetical protein